MNNSLDFLISEAKNDSTVTFDRLLEDSKTHGIEAQELKMAIDDLVSFNVDYSNNVVEEYVLDDLLPLSTEQQVFCNDSLSEELSEVIWLKDAYLVEISHWDLVEDNISKILNSYPILYSTIVNIDLNYYIKIEPERIILCDSEIDKFEDFHSFQRELLFKQRPLIGSNLCRVYRVKITNEDRFIVVAELNHIISDGWSMEVLRSKLLSDCPISDKIHSKFLNVVTSRRINESGIAGVCDQLEELNRTSKDLRAEYLEQRIDGSRFDIINKFCIEMGISTFAFFYSLLALAEYQLNPKKSVSIGSAVNGRDDSVMWDEIYCFIRFIQLNCTIEDQTLIEFLRHNHAMSQKSVIANDSITAEAIEAYHLILILHNFSNGSSTMIDHTKIELLSSDQSTNYVTYNIWQEVDSSSFTIKIDYPKLQFEREYVQSLTSRFVRLINSFEIDLKTNIQDLCIS